MLQYCGLLSYRTVQSSRWVLKLLRMILQPSLTVKIKVTSSSETSVQTYPLYIFNIITDLINTLPGNSSVNKVQHATIEEAVFSVDPTDAPIDWLDNDHVMCLL
jgi:hypothetical protein